MSTLVIVRRAQHSKVDKTNRASCGFTRVELCAVLIAVGLMTALVIPVLAGARNQAQQLVCFANLRQVGQGYGIWATDHAGLFPFYVPIEAGGIAAPYKGDYIQANPWFQFAWISNELRTPKILVCPADAPKRVASDFSSAPGGFVHPDYQNSAVSYTVSYPGGLAGHTVLSGDRNVLAEPTTSPCSVFGYGSGISIPFQTHWEPNGPHGESGNLLLRDGSVEFTGNTDLHRYYDVWVNEAGIIHLLRP